MIWVRTFDEQMALGSFWRQILVYKRNIRAHASLKFLCCLQHFDYSSLKNLANFSAFTPFDRQVSLLCAPFDTHLCPTFMLHRKSLSVKLIFFLLLRFFLCQVYTKEAIFSNASFQFSSTHSLFQLTLTSVSGCVFAYICFFMNKQSYSYRVAHTGYLTKRYASVYLLGGRTHLRSNQRWVSAIFIQLRVFRLLFTRMCVWSLVWLSVRVIDVNILCARCVRFFRIVTTNVIPNFF